MRHESIWVCDDIESWEAYRQVLGFQFEMTHFSDRTELQEALKQPARPTLLIADPDYQNVGELASQLPAFVAISRNDNLEHMRAVFATGAQDYILKPLRANELVFRLECLLRKNGLDPIELLPTTIDGAKPSHLTFKERQLLSIFVLASDRTVSRADLFGAMWKGIPFNKKTLDVHLFNLRRKLHPIGYEIVCANQIFSLLKVSK